MDSEPAISDMPAGRPRPLSPNIQIYRPQLTSVLSIANRITGVILSVGAVGLVTWLSAAAAGPRRLWRGSRDHRSWGGQIVLAGCTFAYFLHLCGGLRHLVGTRFTALSSAVDLHLGMGGRRGEHWAHTGGLGSPACSCRGIMAENRSVRRSTLAIAHGSRFGEGGCGVLVGSSVYGDRACAADGLVRGPRSSPIRKRLSSFISWLKTPLTASLRWSCCLIGLFYHSALGLQVVIEDYLHSGAVRSRDRGSPGLLRPHRPGVVAVLRVAFGG